MTVLYDFAGTCMLGSKTPVKYQKITARRHLFSQLANNAIDANFLFTTGSLASCSSYIDEQCCHQKQIAIAIFDDLLKWQNSAVPEATIVMALRMSKVLATHWVCLMVAPHQKVGPLLGA